MLSWSSRRRALVAAVCAAAAFAAVAACGSLGAGSGGNSTNPSDAGLDGNDGSPDTGFPEAGHSEAGVDANVPEGGGGDGGAEAGPPPPPTTLLFVHASPSLPAVRLCWSVNGVFPSMVPFPSSGPMPGTNFEGVPLGGVASMSNADALAAGPLQLYAIDAKLLAGLERGEATPSTCEQLICGPGANLPGACLWQDHTYWVVGSPLTLIHHAANLVSIEGCLAGSTGGACGSGAGGATGNLHAQRVLLEDIPSGATEVVVEAILLTPALAGDAGQSSLDVSYGPQGSTDGGSFVGSLGPEDDPAASTIVTLPTTLAGYGQVGFSYVGLADGGPSQWMSLAQSQDLVDPTQDPSVFFGSGREYVVMVLGDPSAPAYGTTAGDAGFDGTGLHILVVPTPVPEPLDAGSDAYDAATGPSSDAAGD